ncbi:MAG: hypothetical protein WBF66_10665 [Dehalococcoidia bacterium]
MFEAIDRVRFLLFEVLPYCVSETARITRDVVGGASSEAGIRVALMLPAVYLLVRLVLRLLKVLLVAGAFALGVYLYATV